MKKVISLLLSLVICISSVNIVLAAEGMYGGGTGSEQDPYLIKTEEHLRLLAQQVNNGGSSYEGTHFRLENDIELSKLWVPIGVGKIDVSTKKFIDDGSASFKGVFDGNGYTVSNVVLDYYQKLNDEDKKEKLHESDVIGFFGYTYNAVIKNLTVEGSISGNERVGGIVGYAANGTYISNCVNKATVSGENKIGGIAGTVGPGKIENSRKVIDNCVNEGVVSSSLFIYKSSGLMSKGIGGIVGYVDDTNTVIYGCGNNGSVLTGYYVTNKAEEWKRSNHFDGIGGIAGYVNAGTVEECVNTGTVMSERNIGGIVGTLCENGKIIKSGTREKAEDASEKTSVSLGVIEFDVDDILSDKYSVMAENLGGVVGKNDGGLVSECYAYNADIIGMERVGGIAGSNSGRIEKSNVENIRLRGSSVSYKDGNYKVEPFWAYAGGIVGYNKSVIEECITKTSDISSFYNAVGGICGYDDSESDTLINKCKTINCNITSDEHYNTLYNKDIGGIAGIGKNIKDSWTEGEDGRIRGHENVGGIVGRNIGAIDGCHNMSNITGNSNIGGIVGENLKNCTVTNCYNERFFSGQGTYLGGIVGRNKGKVEKCYNTGAIETSGGLFENAGGIAGINDVGSVIDKCYNEASISGKNNIGGISGINDNGTVKNSYNEGGISGQDKVGGIVGLNEWLSASSEISKDAYIVNSFNKGTVDGGTDVTNAGGISGINQGYIDNCYNSGEVKYAEAQAGYRGLLAGNSPEHSKIMNSYSKVYDVPLCGSETEGVVDASTVAKITKSKESMTLKKLNDYVDADTENNLVDWGYVKGEPELLLNGEKSNIARVTLEQVDGGTIKFADTDDSYKFIEKGSVISVIITAEENSKFSGLVYGGGFVAVDEMTLSDGVYTFNAPDEFDIRFSPVFGDGTFITGAKALDSTKNIIKKTVDVNKISKIEVGLTTTDTSVTSDMIVGAYDSEDSFIGIVTIKNDGVFTDKKVTWTLDNISVPVNTSKLKIFAWNDIDTMQPITKNIYSIYFENPYVMDGMKLQLDSILSKVDGDKWYNLIGDDYYVLNKVTQGENALSFNGTNSYAQSNEEVDMGSSPRTIELTVNNSMYNSGRSSYMFGMGTNDESNLLIGLNSSNSVVIYAGNSSNTFEYTRDKIRSISLTVGDAKVKVYVNGIFVREFNVSVNTSAGKIRLGTSSNSGGIPDRYWKGDIHSVRIYDRQLSDEEIKSNYDADMKRFAE